MQDPALIDALEEFGLSRKEALVYHSALRLGPSSVTSIARHAELPRTTVYSIVAKLKEKQLIRREIRGIKEFFVAESPERLRSVLETRLDSVLGILPQLTALHRLEGAGSVIRFYEGLDALEQIYLELLRSVKIGEDYLVMGDMQCWRNLDQKFFDDFVNARGKLDINVRMILTDSDWARHRKGPGRKSNERSRILARGTALTTNLVIIPAFAFVHELVPPYTGMVFENAHIIRMLREMYEIMWSALKD